MPSPLTEELLARGILDPDQASALARHLADSGGSQDTALLELGVVDETQLTSALAAVYGTELATPDMATDTRDVAATRAFPEQWARRYRLVPFSLDRARGELRVLAAGPLDTSLLTRLGAVLELTVVPVVAPEVRVLQRLSILYGDPLPERATRLLHHSSGSLVPRPISQRISQLPPAPDIEADAQFQEALARLREARGRDEIIHQALAVARREFDFAALFVINEGRLVGWSALGFGSENIARVVIENDGRSAFWTALRTQAYFLGPLPPEDQRLLSALERPLPRAALILPLRVRDRPVAMLYAENGPRAISPRAASDLMLFTTYVRQSLEDLVLRRKHTLSPSADLSGVRQPSWMAPSAGVTPARHSAPPPRASVDPLAGLTSSPSPAPLMPSPPTFDAALASAIDLARASLEPQPGRTSLGPQILIEDPVDAVISELQGSLPVPEAVVSQTPSLTAEDELPKIDVPQIEVPAIDVSQIDLSRLITGGQPAILPPAPDLPPIPPPQIHVPASFAEVPLWAEQMPTAPESPSDPPDEDLSAKISDPVVISTEQAEEADEAEKPAEAEIPVAPEVVAPMTVSMEDVPDISGDLAVPPPLSQTPFDLATTPVEMIIEPKGIGQEIENLTDSVAERIQEVLDSMPERPEPQAPILTARDHLLESHGRNGSPVPASFPPAPLFETQEGETHIPDPLPPEEDEITAIVPETTEEQAFDDIEVEVDDSREGEAVEWANLADAAISELESAPDPSPRIEELLAAPLAPLAETPSSVEETPKSQEPEAEAEETPQEAAPSEETPEAAAEGQEADRTEPMPVPSAVEAASPAPVREPPPRGESQRAMARASLPPRVVAENPSAWQSKVEAAWDEWSSPPTPLAKSESKPAEPAAPQAPQEIAPRRIDPELSREVWLRASARPVRADTPLPKMPSTPPRPSDSSDLYRPNQVLAHSGQIEGRDAIEELPLSSRAPIEELVGDLGAPTADRRERARVALIAKGSSVLPALMKRFPGRVVVDPFAPSAEVPPFASCGELLSVIASFGPEAHSFVVERLDDPLPTLRFFALYFYSAVPLPEAIPRIIRRLHDEEPTISMLAVNILLGYKDHPAFKQVVQHLHTRLATPSLDARKRAARLLAQFRDTSAVPLLIAVFERKEKSFYDAAENALAEITKQRFGPNPKKWALWWENHGSEPRVAWLLDGLESPDADLRRQSADELRTLSGIDPGYDENGPRKQRDDAKRRWQSWWNETSRSDVTRTTV
jgi:hypothetical protein